VVPAQFRVIVTHRPNYACRACEEAVVQAPAPERLIKRGLPTEAMVAYVLVAKYAWHLPLYRQAQMLLALDIKRAILAFWVGYAAAKLCSIFGCANSFSAPARSRSTKLLAGAGSRPRPHQERIFLGHCPRRSAVGRDRRIERAPSISYQAISISPCPVILARPTKHFIKPFTVPAIIVHSYISKISSRPGGTAVNSAHEKRFVKGQMPLVKGQMPRV
jgi:hypothetical protein